VQTTDGESLVVGARTKYAVDEYHMMATARLRQDDSQREQRSDGLYKADGAGPRSDHCDASASIGIMTALNGNDEQLVQPSYTSEHGCEEVVETRPPTWLISHVRGSTYLPQIVGLYHGGRSPRDPL